MTVAAQPRLPALLTSALDVPPSPTTVRAPSTDWRMQYKGQQKPVPLDLRCSRGFPLQPVLGLLLLSSGILAF